MIWLHRVSEEASLPTIAGDVLASGRPGNRRRHCSRDATSVNEAEAALCAAGAPQKVTNQAVQAPGEGRGTGDAVFTAHRTALQ